MKGKRIKSLAIVLCATVIIAGVAGTNAYFTAKEKAHNVITSGNVDIDLIEMADSDGDGENLVPFEDVTGVTPGEDVSKIVTVKNTGGQPAWVRIKLMQAITLEDGSTENVDLSLVTCNINTDYWTAADGYYYYNEALNPNAETEPLFTAVSFAPEMDNLYQNSKVEINVQAQATQVANNGNTVLEANGWPLE